MKQSDWEAIEALMREVAREHPAAAGAANAAMRYGRRANAAYLRDRAAWRCWTALCEFAATYISHGHAAALAAGEARHRACRPLLEEAVRDVYH